ncbi:MAG TPA: FtsX-like permease family protein [Acidobacteriota bacterium]|nr:FtsX-like permease family protein [Acidobacteriota bacterium]
MGKLKQVYFLALISVTAVALVATTALLAFIHPVFLKPLSFRDQDRLVAFVQEPQGSLESWSYPLLELVEREAASIEVAGGFRSKSFELIPQQGQSVGIEGLLVSKDFFSVLGERPLLGTTLSESQEGGELPAVVSFGFWRSRLGGRRDCLGELIQLDQGTIRIVGIMPEGFSFPHRDVKIWVPLEQTFSSALSVPWARILTPIARLAADANPRQAAQELRQLQKAIGGDYRWQASPAVQSLAAVLPLLSKRRQGGDDAATLMALTASVGALLLLALVTTAVLTVIHSKQTASEIAVRKALGCPRWRFMGQVVLETVFAMSLAAVAGVSGGILLTEWLIAQAPPDLTRADEIGFSMRVIALALLPAVACVVVVVCVAGWHRWKVDSWISLSQSITKPARGEGRSSGWVDTLLAGQITFATVIMLSAGVPTLVWFKASSLSEAGTPYRLLQAIRVSNQARTSGAGDGPLLEYQSLKEVLQGPEGPVSVALSSGLPFENYTGSTFFTVLGPEHHGKVIQAREKYISSGYFKTLGIPLVQGRAFREKESRPTAIVDLSTANSLWPDGALGKRLKIGWPDEPGEHVTIVGVVDNPHRQNAVSSQWEDVQGTNNIYLHFDSEPLVHCWVIFQTKEGSPAALGDWLVENLQAVFPDLAVRRPLGFTEMLAVEISRLRFTSLVLLIFSSAALFTAVLGIYAAFSHMCFSRMREFSIRKALGAGPKHLAASGLFRLLRTTVVGLLLGLLGSSLALSYISRVLRGLPQESVVPYVAVAVLVAGASTFAFLIPFRRVVKESPTRYLHLP